MRSLHTLRPLNFKNGCIAALLSSCLVLVSFHSDQALACIVPSQGRTPFFDDIPANIDKPVILRVTVTSLLESPWDPKWNDPASKRRSFNALARVDRVLKGSIDSETVRLAAPPSSCDRPFAIGDSGIVIGTPRVRESGMIELHLISESMDERA